MKLPYLQLSVCGIALLAALSACGTSHPQNNSNTNWLRECSASKDCNSDEQCACGVCTVACTSDDACQSDQAPDAVCASVAELKCSGSGKGAVCTASCKRDSDCGDGELSCVEGSCVAARSSTGKPERDAAVELDPDTGVEDAGSMEMTKPPTKDSSIPVDGSEPVEPPTKDASMPVDGSEPVEPTGPLWSGNGCERAAENRSGCTTDSDCDQGLVCHIDRTCIEPGKCDVYGMTTYASVTNARDLTVTKDSVFVLEGGTEDALGNSRSDGAVVRVGFDGSVEPVITGLDRPLTMKMDPNRMYWRGGVSGQITLSSADRQGGANRIEIPFAGANMQWEQSSTHIYVATDEHQPRYELYRFAKGTSDVETLSDESWSGVAEAMVIDSENVYVSSEDDGRWSLTDHAFHAGVRVSEPSFVDRERLYYVELNRSPYLWRIGELSKSDNKLTTIAEVPFAADSSTPELHPYRNHVYFAVSDGGDTTLYRAPIIPGEREKLLDLGDAFAIAVSDRGVFWIQDHRLMSMVIEDYADGPSPAQGAEGGPCFGDLACDDGLTCVDAVCTVVVPTCEERLGCGVDEACLNERCQPLWSGNGCEPAAKTRPACSSDEDCDQGRVCHIDHTCIEPGKCDRFGTTTVGSLPVAKASQLILTKDDAFVLDYGTQDKLGNHNGDGAIVRVSLEDGSAQTLVTALKRPQGMWVDPTHIHWTTSAPAGDTLISADRSNLENRLEQTPNEGGSVHDASHVYFTAKQSDGTFELFRELSGTNTPEKLTDEHWIGVSNLAVDGQYAYVAADGEESVQRVPITGGVATPALFRFDGVFDRDYFFYVSSGPSYEEIDALRRDGSDLLILLGMQERGLHLLRSYRGHVYFSRLFPTIDPPASMDFWRVSIVPSPSEDFFANIPYASFGGLDISDRGLYWIEDHRLIRHVIEDYGQSLTPAQGASGGPCYGDLACDGALTCVDFLCQ